MGDTTQAARHQSSIERQMGNIIKDMSLDKRDELKRKLQDADNSQYHVDVVSILRPAQVCETQDNLEDPEGREDSNMLESSM